MCELAARAIGNVESENVMTVSNLVIFLNDGLELKAEEYCKKMVNSNNLIHCNEKDLSKIPLISIRNQVKKMMKLIKRKPSKEKKRKRQIGKKMDKRKRQNVIRSKQRRKKRHGKEKETKSKG